MKIDFDRYGHCVLCHKNMLIEQVVGQKVIKRFTADYQETEFLLDDKSKMRVAICKKCKDKLTDGDTTRIMDSVKKGWEKELETLDWSEEKKKNYLEGYSKKQILCNSEGIPTDIIEKKHKEFLERKNVSK